MGMRMTAKKMSTRTYGQSSEPATRGWSSTSLAGDEESDELCGAASCSFCSSRVIILDDESEEDMKDDQFFVEYRTRSESK